MLRFSYRFCIPMFLIDLTGVQCPGDMKNPLSATCVKNIYCHRAGKMQNIRFNKLIWINMLNSVNSIKSFKVRLKEIPYIFFHYYFPLHTLYFNNKIIAAAFLSPSWSALQLGWCAVCTLATVLRFGNRKGGVSHAKETKTFTVLNTALGKRLVAGRYPILPLFSCKF